WRRTNPGNGTTRGQISGYATQDRLWAAAHTRSKDKNDRKDAERLAKLLYLGEAPAVHVPSGDVRTWRELITCRARVIAKRTRAKNSLRTLLRCAGVVPPGRPAPWTKKGLERFRRLELPTHPQPL